MALFIDELRGTVLLSFSDVLNMKTEIASKFQSQSSIERAQKLSQNVNDHLDSALTGIRPSHVHEIKNSLIKKYVVEEQRDIFNIDVIHTLDILPIPNEEKSDVIENWLIKTLDSYEAGDIKAYLENTSPPSDARKQMIFPGYSNYVIGIFLLVFITLNAIAFMWWSQPQDGLGPYGVDIRLIESITKNASGMWQVDDVPIENPFAHGHSHYTYGSFNYIELRNYLKLERDSYLVSDTYLNEIILIAREHDIDPLLLIAIIGQEQGFIPIQTEFKHLIINNPFNVFYSWEHYNTTLYDSTNFAIHLIQDRLESLPQGEDPMIWLNGVYAEDPSWSKGVQSLYDTLTKLCRK